MKEKHIILRSSGNPSRDVFLGPRAMTTAGMSAPVGITVDIEEMDRSRISSVTRHSDVLAVAPAMPVRLIEPVTTNEPAEPAAEQIPWGIKAVGADTTPYSGNGVVVAVLDTGIDAAHAAFQGVQIIQHDFTGEGNGDQNGHGTHCAGSVFGRTVNNTRIGVATGIQKALIGKVLGEQGGGSSEMIIGAIQWAVENGANIISMSLGIDFPGFVKRLIGGGMPADLATSRALEGYRANIQLFEKLADLVRLQGQEGFSQSAIIVAAAGNESRREVNKDYEIAVSPPAVADGIISVAALGLQSNGLYKIADFSNTGANVSGPGVNIISAKTGGGLVSFSGTSMATPYVAGVAALWAEKIMNTGILNPMQHTARLVASGVNTGLVVGTDPFDIGAGLVKAPQ